MRSLGMETAKGTWIAFQRWAEMPCTRLTGQSKMMNDDRPWDEPGSFRFDYEPHRGTFLLVLADISLSCAILALVLAGIPVLVSLPLSIAVQLMARKDLRKIDARQMDPNGEDVMSKARQRARSSTVM